MNEESKVLAREIDLRQLAVVALIGAIVAVITFALGFMLHQYVFGPIACQTESSLVKCADTVTISQNVALLLGSVVGLTFLVRRIVYRPLLAILGVIVSLWGVAASMESVYWLSALGLNILLFAVCYGLFVWLSVFRRFLVSVVLVALTALVLRLVFLI